MHPHSAVWTEIKHITESKQKKLGKKSILKPNVKVKPMSMYHKQLLIIFEQTPVNKRKPEQIIHSVVVWMCALVNVTHGYTECGEVRCYVNNVESLVALGWLYW